MPEMNEVREARIEIGQVCEPGDVAAHILLAVAGPQTTADVVTGRAASIPCLDEYVEGLRAAGYQDPLKAAGEALRRWHARAEQLKPASSLREQMAEIGAHYLVPEDAAWPARLLDLGLSQPYGLWVRTGSRGAGTARDARTALAACEVSLAVVGTREATQYGLEITHRIAARCRDTGVTVISGGAIGIDGRAHASALERDAAAGRRGMSTVAVLAGGIDRFYPASHHRLFEDILAGGALISEATPGGAPTRWRFLQRNRLIAALSGAVVVVEARVRSGALSTANHALTIGRDVGAVPGNITSELSAGCHALLQTTASAVIAEPDDALRLLKRPDGSYIPEGIGPSPMPNARGIARARVTDGMTEKQLAVYEATPVRRPVDVARIARWAGLSADEALGVLADFDLRGYVRRAEGKWVRTR
ncbi:DNA-processing protein DprA [Falsarthrobacter nasiphocae]|uniref:DNA processing protein n=1 Tax=Falsarthrobacter nasiphocae TaxID=189863 RepID=A0AAE3YIW6_9MICC|nr:DNA-processing protein DprA [Falsarthrobacter nasiphocae]MDR6892871.1 DNA processing protein [Falsarthrobacter nasiphocae]